MAGNHYRDRQRGSYGRSDSIFDDEPHDRHQSEGGRGFFERAGQEVRSWLGGNEERSGQGGSRSHFGNYDRSYEGSSGTGRVQSLSEANHNRSPGEPWGGGSDWSSGRNEQGWAGGRGPHQSSGGGSPFDDHYRSWRERQISQLDREYDEYRQHRQQQFESDFSTWRQNRGQGQGQAGATGITSGRTGSQGLSQGSGAVSGQGGGSQGPLPAMPSGGTTAEGGSNLAPDASTGSSGRQSGSRRKS